MEWQRLAKLPKGLVQSGIGNFFSSSCLCILFLGCSHEQFSGDALFGKINATLNKVEKQAQAPARTPIHPEPLVNGNIYLPSENKGTSMAMLQQNINEAPLVR